MTQENLLASFKNIISTGIEIFETRLELLSMDIQIAQVKFITLVVLIACAIFFVFLGVVLLSLMVVIIFWESNKILALGLLALVFLLIGLIFSYVVYQSFRTMPRLFEASLGELSKDREYLSSRR